MQTAAEIAQQFAISSTAARDLETAILRHMEHHVVQAVDNTHRIRNEEMRFMTGRIGDLLAALSELVAMETDRYACASERNAAYDRARKLLGTSE